MAKWSFKNIKSPFSSRGGEEKASKKKPAESKDIANASDIREAYTTIVLELNQKGYDLAQHKDEALKLTTRLATSWVGREISPETVRHD